MGKRCPTLKFKKQLGKYKYKFSTDEQRKQRNILVLDWEGNPVKLLKTGQRLMCFAVDEENQMGYGIIQDPEDKLVSFKYNL